MVTKHFPHVQVFHGDHLVIADQPRRLFMQEVASCIGNLFVDSGDTDTLLVTVAGTGVLAGKLPLFTGKLLLIPAERMLIGNNIPVAICLEVLNADVNTDSIAGIGLWDDLFHHAKGDEVFAGRSQGYSRVQDTPAEITGLSNLDKADLRNPDLSGFKTDSVSLVPCAIGLDMAVLAAVLRITGALVKKRPERFVQVFDRFLQRHTVTVFQPRGIRAGSHLRDPAHVLELRNIPVFRSVCVFAEMEGVIVDKATTAED